MTGLSIPDMTAFAAHRLSAKFAPESLNAFHPTETDLGGPEITEDQ
jgi:hypothetical protein